jgi:hypothetical protein
MGHDISAYIKTKDSKSDEVSYFRISAFDNRRQRVFYGTLKGSEIANAGVSGDGSEVVFSIEDITNAISACDYFLNDEDALVEHILSKKMKAEDNQEQFKKVISMFIERMGVPAAEDDDTKDQSDNIMNVQEALEDIMDTIRFHNDIVYAYEETKDAQGVEIHFG